MSRQVGHSTKVDPPVALLSKYFSNSPLQKRERTGKEKGCFPFV